MKSLCKFEVVLQKYTNKRPRFWLILIQVGWLASVACHWVNCLRFILWHIHIATDSSAVSVRHHQGKWIAFFLPKNTYIV